MELPDDIRGIISAFSKPHFIHFREYNRALRVHHLSSWPSLKHALMTNPDKVLDALLQYQLTELSLTCARYNYCETWYCDDTIEAQMFEKSEKFKEAKENLYKLLEN